MDITRDNLAIEHGTADWGGPTAKVTVNAGPLEGRVFTLRSTQGLDSGTAAELSKGGGIHVASGDPEATRPDWRGVFKTFDMDRAIGWLVGEVNELAERKRVEDATWSERAELDEAVEHFGDSLGESSRRDFREEWQRVQRAVVALEMKMQEVMAP